MSVDSRELTVLVHVDCIMNFLPSCCRRPKCRLKSFLTVCLALGVLGTCLILTVYHIDVNVVSSKRAQVGATFGETRSVGSSQATPSERGEEHQGQDPSNTGQSWQMNKTALLQLRQNLKPLQTAKRFVLSQDTSAKKRRLPFVFRPKNSLYMKDDMFYTLPKVSPFSGRSLGVCSLVGNGGILTGSKCGEQIDSSDFVIRFNMAPVCPPYLDDIGRRTDMVTTSRDRMRSKFDSLKSHTGREKFVNHLHHQYGQDTYIVSAPFTVKGNIGSLLGIPEVLTSHNSSAVPLFINPSHAGTMLQTWRKLGLKLSEGETNFSSGFYYASVALELCDQVNMYGFWPFPEDREGRPVRYHYYKSVDSGGLNNRWHDMDKEFEKLLEFHNHGVLQLISGNCR
ncbi:CMP-N-acetylneuraminate-poly-alpha-2,8-sialyltransferase-like isoform X1 [Branchiostoma lanceolatum]|uniref:CMP-N-acetylneuraminate-poly-alpha-2, 8-sialyltransferase-like isoform X1 n=1 Tax=Branchiostoma lanceolatum TaxID=7740 RepID=UPI0034538FA8